MWKVRLVIFTILHCLILQVNSKITIENVTVSSDYIQNLFFEEIRSNPNFSDIFESRQIKDEHKCFDQLKEIAKTFPSYNALRFVDAWGKFPSGLLSGHTTDLGNYDQCVKTSVVLIPSHGITNGKYCFTSFPLLLSRSLFPDSDETSSNNERDLSHPFGYSIRTTCNVKLGICIPDVCNPKSVNRILKKSVGRSLNGLLSESLVSNCSVAKKPDFNTVDIIAIVIYSLIGILMILSTAYDFWTTYSQKRTVPLLLAFSVITNGRKIFAINTQKSSNSIGCLNGIRVLSMFWVINCHNYLFYAQLNVSNIIDAPIWANKLGSLTVLMGTLSVDSFFMISGLLVAWLGLKELDKRKGKLNIALMYLHRYIRLTPALAAVILFYVSFNKHIGSGPFRTISQGCDKFWWHTLLYIQNYVSGGLGCVVQSWYLACDTQLYVLSPLILWPLWKWGRKIIPAIVVLALLSIGCVIGTYFVEGSTSLLGFAKPLGTVPRTYIKTHTRYSPWLVGIVLGYILYVNRNKSFRLSKITQIVGWVVSVGTLLCIIFIPYYASSKFPYNSSVFFAAIYESLKRFFWAIALAWIVFVCHFGFGGLVNSVLSHPLWQPLGRLNYCMYLVHWTVQELKYKTSRTDVYFSDNVMFLEFCSTLGMTIVVALVLSLSFEAPLMIIEKAIFGRGKEKSDSCEKLVVSLPAPFETRTA